MRKMIALLVMAVIIGSTFTLPVSAEEDNTPASFDVFSDPATVQRALGIYELEQAAKAGDSESLNLLKSVGEEVKDVFPNGSLVGGAWSNATKIALENWGQRKGMDDETLVQDNSARLQAAAAAGLVPYRTPAPAFSRNILVTRDEGTPIQNEPYLCVNPQDPNNVVVVAHNYAYGPSATAVTSFDGGETWTTARYVPKSQRAVFSGDPVVACGANDMVYFNFMSLGADSYMFLNQAISILRSDIVVSTSDDGGMTWDQPSVVATNRIALETFPLEDPKTGELVEVPVVTSSFLDKNWTTLGPNPNDPAKEMLYVSYTEFVNYYYITQPIKGVYMLIYLQGTSEIKVQSSSNNGRTWKDTNMMQPMPAIEDVLGTLQAGVSPLYYRAVQGSQLIVGTDGTLHAAWYDSTQDGYALGKARFYVSSSTDMGHTWSEPVLAAEANEMQRQSRSVPFRTSPAHLGLAAGPNGEVYVVFNAKTAGKAEDDGDVWFVSGSQDKSGQLVFGEPAVVNEDQTNTIQFFPAIAVAPDGSIHLMWGDARDDPAGLRYNIYYTRSEDGGKTWGFEVRGIREPDTRVTDFYSNPNRGFPNGRFIGDYFGIAATDNDVYMVWTDTRLGEYGPFNSKIGFARRSAVASPSAILNPSRGPAGQAVAVQAHGFQPDMSVFVQVGGDIITCGKTSDSGTVSCETVMPFMSGDQSQQVRVFDESGNLAVTSYYVESDSSAVNDPRTNNPSDTDKKNSNSPINLVVGLGIIILTGASTLFVLWRVDKKKKEKDDKLGRNLPL